MKKLLLILLCVPIIGFGQTDENITLQKKVEDISYSLDKHHQQYYTGATITIVGVGIATIGLVITLPAVSIIGGIGLLVGNITMIDSHKWFNNIIKNEHKYLQKLNKRLSHLEYLNESGEISNEQYIKEINKIKKIIKDL